MCAGCRGLFVLGRQWLLRVQRVPFTAVFYLCLLSSGLWFRYVLGYCHNFRFSGHEMRYWFYYWHFYCVFAQIADRGSVQFLKTTHLFEIASAGSALRVGSKRWEPVASRWMILMNAMLVMTAEVKHRGSGCMYGFVLPISSCV